MSSDKEKPGDWKETCIHGVRPDWYVALDDDLRAIIAPFMWYEELKTGKMVLREHDMYRALRDALMREQAQRVELARLRAALESIERGAKLSGDSERAHSCQLSYDELLLGYYGVAESARAALDGDA